MSPHIPAALRRQIHADFAGRCAYCRTIEQLTVVIFEVEHIVPLSAGGETSTENLCLACPTCNRYKSVRQQLPDPQSGQTVAIFNPRQMAWTDHFQWDETATELVGLTAIGRVTIAGLRMNRPQLVRVRRMWATLGLHP